MNELYVIIDLIRTTLLCIWFLLTELCLTNSKDSFNNHFLFFLQMLFLYPYYFYYLDSVLFTNIFLADF